MVVETKPYGQKPIGGNRPAFSKMLEQVEYGKGGGNYYSLLVGREYKPDQYAVLLDVDNKDEGDVRHRLKLAAALHMYQYDAPRQHTPTRGLHYIFYVDGEQAKRIGSITVITYKGVKYAMGAKFKHVLCNCQPSQNASDGAYKFEDAYASTLGHAKATRRAVQPKKQA